MSRELEGKTALLTGASRGIGVGIATASAQAGADVAVNSVGREPEARKLCTEIQGSGRRSLAVQAGVSVSSEVSNMVARSEAEFGSISILVNNAGISRPQPLDQITERDWDGILALNLKSMFLDCSASKFAINGLAQALADEGKAGQIKAIAICPAMVATPMTGGSGPEYLQA